MWIFAFDIKIIRQKVELQKEKEEKWKGLKIKSENLNFTESKKKFKNSESNEYTKYLLQSHSVNIHKNYKINK